MSMKILQQGSIGRQDEQADLPVVTQADEDARKESEKI